MPENVNFVKHRRRLLTKRQGQDQSLFRLSLIIVIVCFVLFLIAAGLRVYFSYSLNRVITQQNTYKTLVEGQQDNERAYLVFAAKLKILAGLFDQRRDKQQAIEYFTHAFDQNVLLSNISYEETGSLLTLGLQSNNIFVLQTVLDTLQDQVVRQQFQSLALSELKRSNLGQYQVTVTVVLNSASQSATTTK